MQKAMIKLLYQPLKVFSKQLKLCLHIEVFVSINCGMKLIFLRIDFSFGFFSFFSSFSMLSSCILEVLLYFSSASFKNSSA